MHSDHRLNASATGLTMSTSGPLYQAMTVSLYTVRSSDLFSSFMVVSCAVLQWLPLNKERAARTPTHGTLTDLHSMHL